jgi:hypothetical protein
MPPRLIAGSQTAKPSFAFGSLLILEIAAKHLPAAAFSLLTQPTISQSELVEIRKTRLPLTNKVAILFKSP